jgi:hypothetical protein
MKMKEMDFAELKLADKLDKASPKYEVITKMVDAFNGFNANDAQSLIDGMKQELRMFYSNEMKTRKLEELKATWLD